MNTTPEGFKLVENFISVGDEKKIKKILDKLDYWPVPSEPGGGRVVKFFGYRHAVMSKASSVVFIPESLQVLGEKCEKFVKASLPQVLISRYPVGSFIDWHQDARHDPITVAVSLESDCTLEFRKIKNHKRLIRIKIPRRSVYVISGEAWHSWEHRVPTVESFRYSLTWRRNL